MEGRISSGRRRRDIVRMHLGCQWGHLRFLLYQRFRLRFIIAFAWIGSTVLLGNSCSLLRSYGFAHGNFGFSSMLWRICCIFETSLQPYKLYYISNAYVKPVRVGYEVSDYEFSWTLYNIASVQPLDEDMPPSIPYDFQFKHFSKMFRYTDRETPINIKALIVQASPVKKVGGDLFGQDLIAQDFVVVDTNKTPMIMRLWKEKIREYGDILSEGLPNAMMFVGMNMKVTTFNDQDCMDCWKNRLVPGQERFWYMACKNCH